MVVKHCFGHWRIDRPEVVITVVGGSRFGATKNFALNPRLKGIFTSGLVEAVSSTRAVIFTSGFDTGVFKLVGDTLSSNDNVSPPAALIGIQTFETVMGRERLARASGHSVQYPSDLKQLDTWAAPLSPTHTHFVCIDVDWQRKEADKEGPWGSELVVRAKVEHAMSLHCNVPLVTLVVGGGPGSILSILASTKDTTASVIVVEAGGSCLALYEYFKKDGGLSLDDLEMPPEVTPAEMEKAHKLIPIVREHLDEIRSLNRAAGNSLIHFFVMGPESGSNNLSRAILKAIIARTANMTTPPTQPPHKLDRRLSAQERQIESAERVRRADAEHERSNLSSALMLAVKWNRPDVTAPLFQRCAEFDSNLCSLPVTRHCIVLSTRSPPSRDTGRGIEACVLQVG